MLKSRAAPGWECPWRGGRIGPWGVSLAGTGRNGEMLRNRRATRRLPLRFNWAAPPVQRDQGFLVGQGQVFCRPRIAAKGGPKQASATPRSRHHQPRRCFQGGLQRSRPRRCRRAAQDARAGRAEAPGPCKPGLELRAARLRELAKATPPRGVAAESALASRVQVCAPPAGQQRRSDPGTPSANCRVWVPTEAVEQHTERFHQA